MAFRHFKISAFLCLNVSLEHDQVWMTGKHSNFSHGPPIECLGKEFPFKQKLR